MNRHGLGPAWVGTSFGTETSYVQIIIIRSNLFLDIIEIKKKIFTYSDNITLKNLFNIR